MLEIIRAGGPVLYVIIFCSIVALGFAIERFISIQQAQCNIEKFFVPLENAIKLGRFDEAVNHCEGAGGLIPQVILVGLRHKDENIEDIRRILIDEIQINTLPKLQKRLSVLVTIARGAPMLGLLGTVIGMIGMFDVISKAGMDPQQLAGDIRLALVTTAGGLMVAIPIIFVHAYFRSRIREFELDLYNCLTRFLRLMRKRKELGR